MTADKKPPLPSTPGAPTFTPAGAAIDALVKSLRKPVDISRPRPLKATAEAK